MSAVFRLSKAPECFRKQACSDRRLGLEHMFIGRLALRAQLNRVVWRPARDYASNRLVGGALQLPAHTALLLDETALAAGALTAAGVENLRVGPCSGTCRDDTASANAVTRSGYAP